MSARVSLLLLAAALLASALVSHAQATQPTEVSAGPAAQAPKGLAQTSSPAGPDAPLERRVMEIAEGLRCLVCQNQTIADSSAELAVDLRQQIRVQLQQGRDESAILQFMVERYGDFVLYKPPLKAATALLWFGPLLLLALACAVMITLLRRRARVPAAPLSEPEQAAADRLLGISPESKP